MVRVRNDKRERARSRAELAEERPRGTITVRFFSPPRFFRAFVFFAFVFFFSPVVLPSAREALRENEKKKKTEKEKRFRLFN